MRVLIGSHAASSTAGRAEIGAIGEFAILDHRILIVPIERDSARRQPNETTIDDQPFMIAGKLRLAEQDFLLVEVTQAERIEHRDSCEILTGREMQIARMVALGMPNKQIAFKLHISEWTVATHLRRIFAKLGVESRAAMVFRCALDINRSELPEFSARRDAPACARTTRPRDG